jgi:tetratricopeptide (TPR) repeat protein
MPSVSRVAELRALSGSGMMCYALGDLARARSMLVRAVALVPDSSDQEASAQAEHLLGYVEHAQGNLEAAREHFLRSIDLFRTLSGHWGCGHALSGLAWVALATGDADEAERLLDEASALLRGAGPWYSLLNGYIRAILALRRGRPDEAITVVRGNLVQIRKLHDKFAFVYALLALATAASLKGEDAWAARILGARDAVIERTGASYVDQSAHDLVERAERDARARLGPHQWARAYAAGRGTSIDGLLKEIDSRVAATARSVGT